MATTSIVNDFLSLVQRPGGGEFIGILALGLIAVAIFGYFLFEAVRGTVRQRRVRRELRAMDQIGAERRLRVVARTGGR